jgi:hypothetical protein
MCNDGRLFLNFSLFITVVNLFHKFSDSRKQLNMVRVLFINQILIVHVYCDRAICAWE